MATKRRRKKKGELASQDHSINIGGSVGPGSAIGKEASVKATHIAGRDIKLGPEKNQVTDAFAQIYEAIRINPVLDAQTAENVKEAVKVIESEVKVIESENEKAKAANKASLNFSFKMLARMAPDIFEVVITTLTNPILGLSSVVRKIAEKAKAEQSDAEK